MARKPQNSRKKRCRTPAKPAKTQAAPRQLTRRDVVQRIALVCIAGGLVGGGGTAFAYDLRRKLAEQDLSILGSGVPVVVQIHDPRCRQCAQLQRQARRAVRAFDEGDIAFRIANIRSDAGLAFATSQGAAHVTLLLFDGTGRRVSTVEGVTPAPDLITRFQRYLRVAPTG